MILLNFFLQNLFTRQRLFNFFEDSFYVFTTDLTTWFDVVLFKIVFELVFSRKINNSLFSTSWILSSDWSINFSFEKQVFFWFFAVNRLNNLGINDLILLNDCKIRNKTWSSHRVQNNLFHVFLLMIILRWLNIDLT